MAQNRILIVDDDEVTRKNLARLFRREGFHVSDARSGKTALKRLLEASYDLILADLVMDDMDGLELLAEIKGRFPLIEVILVTGYASIPTAIEAVKKGAYHYLEKPIRPEETIHLARQAIEKKRLREQIENLEALVDKDLKAPTLIGQSRGIVEVLELIKQVAQVNCNELITGEPGTGKELAASMIHSFGRRRNNNFLAVLLSGCKRCETLLK